jgi:membrane-associated phospholipid phosphatase
MQNQSNYLTKDRIFSETLFYYLLLSIILFISNQFIPKGDDVLMINGLHTEFLDRLFVALTHLGNGLLFLPLILYACFINYRLALSGLCIWLGHGIICLISKRVLFPDFKRPAAVIDNSLLYFVDGLPVYQHYSFPSGHTATIFCVAIFATLVFKNRLLSIFAMLLALSVGISRIYLVQHFLEDVVAGALIGCVTSFVVYFQFGVGRFPPWMNSRLIIPKKRKKVRYPSPTFS